MEWRFHTTEIEPNTIRYSYWVSFLKWLAWKCENHAEAILDRIR